MKEKNIFRVLVLGCCLLFNTAMAQPKQKAEKAFLHQLNTILKNAKQQHWNFEGTMTVDSAFAINKEGILSVTVRYTNDTSFVITRMEAPVNKIKRVAYDLYLILEYEDELVTFYVSGPGSNELKENGKTNLFHIGAPLGEDVKAQEKLQRALDELLKYHKN